MAELLKFAMEGRRRVKEQLKKLGSFEYHKTSFSNFGKSVEVGNLGGLAQVKTKPFNF